MRLAACCCALALVVSGCSSEEPSRPVASSTRTLVILATWGPRPFSPRQVRKVVFGRVDSLVREMSYGMARMSGDATPWLEVLPRKPDCGYGDLDVMAKAARRAAAGAGFQARAYRYVIYLVPAAANCGFEGFGNPGEVFLFGGLEPDLVAHELGHAFGVGHAYLRECSNGVCDSIEYGDPYTLMGSGSGHYNAFEKHAAGWLTNIEHVARDGDYQLDQLERRSRLPQALVVETAQNEYWLDHRAPILSDRIFSRKPVVRGVLVHGAPPSSDPVAPSDFPEENTLIPDLGGGPVDALLPGRSFREPGAFELTVLRRVGTHVDVRFRWTDRTRPRAPRLSRPALTGRSIDVLWEPSVDRGSGVLRYELQLDGKRARFVRSDFRVPLRAALRVRSPGRHSVQVVAVDRAGNRSAPARRTVVVR